MQKWQTTTKWFQSVVLIFGFNLWFNLWFQFVVLICNFNMWFQFVVSICRINMFFFSIKVSIGLKSFSSCNTAQCSLFYCSSFLQSWYEVSNFFSLPRKYLIRWAFLYFFTFFNKMILRHIWAGKKSSFLFSALLPGK